MLNKEEATKLLEAADLFFDKDEFDGKFVLNMNDVWGWACADGEEVPEDKIIEVAELFWRYGFAGVLYWVSTRNKGAGARSEFHDINRFIDFVANEEKIRADIPDSSKRAYHKTSYTIGE